MSDLYRAGLFMEDFIMGLIRFERDLDIKSVDVTTNGLDYTAKVVFIVKNPIAWNWDNAVEREYEMMLPNITENILTRCAESAVRKVKASAPPRRAI